MNEVRPKVAPLAAPAKPKKGVLTGKCFSWTGYRSAEEESYVSDRGGEVVPFGKRTSVLFYKKDGKASGKVSKAGEKALTFNEWKQGVK
jgi:hypothetical protein